MKFTDEEILSCLLDWTDRLRLAQAESFWATLAVGLLLAVFEIGTEHPYLYAFCLVGNGLRYTYASVKVARFKRLIKMLCSRHEIEPPAIAS